MRALQMHTPSNCKYKAATAKKACFRHSHYSKVERDKIRQASLCGCREEEESVAATGKEANTTVWNKLTIRKKNMLRKG